MADKSYRPEVDGLRSIAVSVVILYHAGFGLFSGGYVGVDVFFVISGYLITSILVRDLAAGHFSIARFYERRARRIFPALFCVMLCCLPLAWLWLTPGQFKDFFQSLVAVTLFVSNIYFWLKSGYFGQNAESIPLIHTWSLSVEEQFYLLHPVVLWLVWRHARAHLATVLGVLAAASLAGCLWLEQRDPGLNFFFSPTRAWELLAGAFVALRAQRWAAGGLGRAPVRTVLSTLGVLLVLLPVFLLDRHSSFPGHLAVPPVLGTALILAFCTPATWLGRLLASRPMVAVGLASYSAYLWHQPIFAFARVVSSSHPTPVAYLALIALVGLLSALSLRFVEAPFRRPVPFSRRAIFNLSLACSLGFIGLGLAGHLARGMPQRFDDARNALAQTVQPSPRRDSCHTEGLQYRPPAQACRYLAEPATWAVFGDSHGVEIAYALAQRLQPAGQGVLHLTFSGCPPALHFDVPANPGCSRWVGEATAFLEQSTTIRQVVLVYRHSFHLYGDQLQTYPQAPDAAPRFLTSGTPAAARQAYWASLQEIVQRLTAAGKTVYLLDPVPELGASIDRVLFKRDLFGRSQIDDSGAPLAYHAQRNQAILAALAEPAFAAARRVHTADAVCTASGCRAIIGGEAMYFDDNHLSMAGALRLVALLAADPAAQLPPPARPATNAGPEARKSTP
jgi:peptidoglycan/LPS O-acetylase OafA/YrhL